MKEIGKALKSIFDKLSDFFDIFDLSFFVSGVATTLSILCWLKWRNYFDFSEVKFEGLVVVYILVCYINGLISFAAGRWIRMGLGGWIKSKFGKKLNQYEAFDQNLVIIVNAHGLNNLPIFKEYLSREELRGTWRLYGRLWAVIRENKKYTNSLSLLKRYWVMAATYDGLTISLLVIMLLFADILLGVFGDKASINLYAGIFIMLILVFFIFSCIREANRYVRYQIEELIATIAAGEK